MKKIIDREKLILAADLAAEVRKKRKLIVDKQKGNWVDYNLAAGYPTIVRWVSVGECLLCGKMFANCGDATKHAKKQHKKEIAELRKRFLV